MPPVLHVSFLKLMSSGKHDLLSRDFRMAVDERHHVLQLIAKTECATGLIKCSAGPDAARECLVKQPAVEHYVQRSVRSFYFDCSENAVPVTENFFKSCVDISCLSEPGDDRFGFTLRPGLAE